FFSSRRRHTRFSRDWSSDVCSSDLIAMQPDALIMSDPGLIMLVRERFPDMPVHLSVQANAVNWASVEFWHRQGLTRVILSRELRSEERRVGQECRCGWSQGAVRRSR